MPASYWRRPFRASASAFFLGSAMSSGSKALLSRLSFWRLIRFSRKFLSLTVDHFARDKLILKSRIPERKAPPLRLALFSCRLNFFGSFQKILERIRHRYHLPDSNHHPTRHVERIDTPCQLTPARLELVWTAMSQICRKSQLVRV